MQKAETVQIQQVKYKCNVDTIKLITDKVIKLIDKSIERDAQIQNDTGTHKKRLERAAKSLDELADIYEELVPYLDVIEDLYPEIYNSQLFDTLNVHRACKVMRENNK